MKKLIFAGLAVLLAISLATCEFGEFGGKQGGGPEYTTVVYDYDTSGAIKGVTLYLDGVGVPVTEAQRALSTEIAKIGHDYYEVVFLYEDASNNPIISRATWTLGQSATITELTRGVDYGSVDPADVDEGTDTGAAILFVGRKDDKTLLAAGALTAVDDATGTTISDVTSSVTFEVTAFKAGLAIGGNGSFVTNQSPVRTAGTDQILINSVQHPYYPIAYDATAVTGTYTITDVTHADGILIADDITNWSDMYEGAILTQGRVPVGGDFHSYVEPMQLGTIVSLTNNDTKDGAFDPAITFSIDPAASSGGFAALTFCIPVYALTDEPGTETTSSSATIWAIRPAYSGYRYYLDSGQTNALGGAVLLRITGVSGTSDIITIITK